MAKEIKDNRSFIWLAAIAIIGSILVFLVTRKWGLGVTVGSMFFVEAARNFVLGAGFSIFSKAGTLEPLASYPPGFPFLLSWGWFLGLDAFHWARFLNIFFFGINIFLAGILAWSWSKNKIAGLVAAGFFLCSPELLNIHLHLLSEPIFFVFLLIFFIALCRYQEVGGKKMFYAVACSAALAGLIKPVEMAFILTAGVVFFGVKGEDFKEKCVKVGFFLLIGGFFPVILCVRNILLGVLAGNVYSILVLGSLKILVFACIIALWQRREKLVSENVVRLTGFPIAFLFMLVYAVSVFPVISFVPSANSSGLGDLSAILVLALIVLACMATRADLKKITLGVVILFAMVSLGFCVNLMVAFVRNGAGYSSKAWTESKVLRELRAIDERVTVFANNPSAVYYLIGRPAIQIPASRWEDGFFPSIETASRMFEKREAVGVVFNEKDFSPGSRWTRLKARAMLKNVMSDSLATIYVQKKVEGKR
ncbi:MAG: hypothetical protein HQL21_08750 [Candidatus Omnitrophica bacterium]|nr:hypothetical protein [Candidatus Omnitrophota bacterium]